MKVSPANGCKTMIDALNGFKAPSEFKVPTKIVDTTQFVTYQIRGKSIYRIVNICDLIEVRLQ